MEIQQKSEEIKSLSRDQLDERISFVKKTILTLEWDKRHNQIHAGMEERYHRLKDEYELLEKQLNAMKVLEKEEPEEETEEMEEEKEKNKEDEELSVLNGIEELEIETEDEKESEDKVQH